MLPGLERGDGLEMAAIFVAEGKPVKKVFDARQADAVKIGGPLGPDAFKDIGEGFEDSRTTARFRFWAGENVEPSRTVGFTEQRSPALEPAGFHECRTARRTAGRSTPLRRRLRLRIVAHDLLQHPGGHRHAGDRSRFERKRARAVLRLEDAVDGDRHGAGR